MPDLPAKDKATIERRCPVCLGFGWIGDYRGHECNHCNGGIIMISESDLEQLLIARKHKQLRDKYGEM